MKRLQFTCIIIFLIILIHTSSYVNGGELSPRLSERLQSIQDEAHISVIVRMVGQPERETATKGIFGRNKALRLKNVIGVLQSTATKGQHDLIAFLEQEKALGNVADYTSFWIFNGISLTATSEVIREISAWDNVDIIRENLPIIPPPVLFPSSQLLPLDPRYTWNIKRIKAPEVWDMGYDGSGIVVGIFDTGVDYTHPTLVEKYRGGDNSWFDPYGEHDQPYDYLGHGTPITGIILGKSTYGKYIGVAPGAKWIAAKFWNDAGESTESDAHKIFQWFMDPDGDPETDDAPDIVNGSWGTTLFHMFTWCSDNFRDDIRAWREAGIIPVFAAGNLGLFPFSGSSPATYPETISVGATDFLDVTWFGSSRGPSNCDLSIFPDITAPGQSIFSPMPDGLFKHWSGTSFSSPHVAGVIALMLNANPDLSFEEIESTLKVTAKPLGLVHPNNTYGCGQVDALEAVKAIIP